MHTDATTGQPEAVKLEGKVRARDRDTSWHAASLQTNGKTAAMQVRIYRTLCTAGPMTDEELLLKLGGDQYTFGGKTTGVTRSGLATRRHELELAGWVIDERVAPGSAVSRKRPTLSGGMATVWRAVTDDEPAPAPRATAEPRATPARPSAAEAHETGMAAATRLARWEIGDSVWARILIGAYLNPAETMARLDEEMGS